MRPARILLHLARVFARHSDILGPLRESAAPFIRMFDRTSVGSLYIVLYQLFIRAALVFC